MNTRWWRKTAALLVLGGTTFALGVGGCTDVFLQRALIGAVL